MRLLKRNEDEAGTLDDIKGRGKRCPALVQAGPRITTCHDPAARLG